MRIRKVFLLFFPLCLGTLILYAQNTPVGFPILEEYWRRAQLLRGTDSNISFCVRPTIPLSNFQQDSTLHLTRRQRISFASGAGSLQWLPVTLKQQVNTHHPYGWNDGSMVPAKGYQAQISMGVLTKIGPLHLQLLPEFVYAQNSAYPTFPQAHTDSIWKAFYDLQVNHIDLPDRYGNRAYTRIFPGQSSIRVNFKKLSFGLSSENLWWGPGIRNSLLMSNNAPGFPHFTLNTQEPISSPIGSFEGQIISGLLYQSGYFPADTSRRFQGEPLFFPKPNTSRYLNGMVLTWQPKWTKGLFLGLSRVFYSNKKDVSSFHGYLPVIGKLFKGNEDSHLAEDSLKQDQMISFFFRFTLPKERAEVYAEFGRNDHAGSSRDLLLEPEHSRAYLIGIKKFFTLKNSADLELMAELTTLQLPNTTLVRATPTWYAHSVVRDGYTHRGQVIGAGIGPGGSSQTIGLNWVKGIQKTGVLFERIVHNNDFYYAAFAPSRNSWSHWVDLSVNLNKSWQHKNFLYDARLSWVKSFNYQWQHYRDVQNIFAALSVSYLF